MTTNNSQRRLAVALTGGIAAGKTEVARHFSERGVEVVDADAVARELVQPGQPVLKEIADAFGSRLIGLDGTLDRRALREIIFADASARRRLEAILHPRIQAALAKRAEQITSPYGLFVIPLLVESGPYPWADRVLVVDVPRELQLARLTAREGISPELADSMLAAQTTREQRIAVANDVIENTGSLTTLNAAVEALHRHYLQLAALKRGL